MSTGVCTNNPKININDGSATAVISAIASTHYLPIAIIASIFSFTTQPLRQQ